MEIKIIGSLICVICGLICALIGHISDVVNRFFFKDPAIPGTAMITLGYSMLAFNLFLSWLAYATWEMWQ